MKKQLILLFFIGLFLQAHAQLLSDSILIEGHYRTFHFAKPGNTNSKESLIFVLHGSGGTGLQIMSGAKKLAAIAATENILLVYPDGYQHFWNECRKASTAIANKENINEEVFFDSMIQYFKSNYGINQHQVFVIGTSGGGHMAYKLALTIPTKIKAITAIIANLPDAKNMDCLASGTAVPVMIINGTNDPVNPYNGGEVKIPGTVLGTVLSTDETFHYWANLAGYKGDPVKELLPDVDPNDGKTIESYHYQEKGKPEIELLKVIGGKHDYPNDIDVYLEAWKFMKRQINY
jgi:polyhydroxybutyrate depolymerase